MLTDVSSALCSAHSIKLLAIPEASFPLMRYINLCLRNLFLSKVLGKVCFILSSGILIVLNVSVNLRSGLNEKYIYIAFSQLAVAGN